MAKAANASDNETREVQCTFRTALPDEFKVEESLEIQLDTNSTNKDLTTVLREIIEGMDEFTEKASTQMKSKKLQFMVNNVFLTTTLQDLMDKLMVQAEQVLEIWYTFALEKPQKKISIPNDEWISVISAYKRMRNTKMSTFVVGFFNGDLKIFDGKNQKQEELVCVQGLHADQITDAAYLKSETMDGKKFLLTCSLEPQPALKVCIVGTESNSVDLISQVSTELSEALGGWNSLSVNPTNNDLIASSSINLLRKPAVTGMEGELDLGSIQMWRLSEDSLYNQVTKTSSSKRQRTEVSTFQPEKVFHLNGGVESLSWLDGDTLIAGCQDHALKLVDVEKSYVVKQSIITHHKVPTCLDTSGGNLILTGCEDATIRLWDARQGQNAAKQIVNEYNGHSSYVKQVEFNPQVEHLFISGSLDGTVKLWDLRNDEVPIANLKQKQDQDATFKVFSARWNGQSQIVSGGSDSHVSVYSI